MALSTQAATAKDRNTGRDAGVSFQHRHFSKVAAIIADRIATHPDTKAQAKTIADIFAQELSFTNANFNRDRFMTACGFND